MIDLHMLTYVRIITSAFVEKYGDNQATRQRAKSRSLEYVTKAHGVSRSTARLYIDVYERFHAMPRAIAVLRQTDMQLLLAPDIGDEIIDAVIQRREGDPRMSTRAVKAFIRSMRSRALQVQIQ
ncbi:hypothetical protein [Paraburkholderia tropica]|uniref:hypothetical protein n=1 Tax=Paraburkholderia tropica TaxID=92647 RepID=UPI0007ECBE38|nr:hypothetical protein [Paraburkholderia tropica]OBR46235.1 hypothetical protein A6456_37215 [Paraburkholderia tropica]